MIELLIEKLKLEMERCKMQMLNGSVSDFTEYRVTLAEYRAYEQVIDMAKKVEAALDDDED